MYEHPFHGPLIPKLKIIMTKTLRLSIIGCGGAANDLAWLAHLTPGVKLTGCCDVSNERAASFARKHRIPRVYTDYEEMLADSPMDAVFLAVPHHLHFEMMKTSVDAGIHVYTEKPITRTYTEGQDIVAYARERNIKIGVNYQYRYDRGCYRLAYLVHSGKLGRVLYARTNIPWHRENAYFEDSPWHKTIAQAGGGTLITQASHLIDTALWVLGSQPVSAMGYTDQKVFTDVEVEDFSTGTVLLEDGAVLQITSSMAAASEQAVTLDIYGERGTAKYTNRPWPRVKFIRGQKPTQDQLKQFDSSLPISSIAETRGRVPYLGYHAMQRCLKGFRDWILEDKPFLNPGEAALPALAVVEAIYRSADEKRWVDIRL